MQVIKELIWRINQCINPGRISTFFQVKENRMKKRKILQKNVISEKSVDFAQKQCTCLEREKKSYKTP